MAVKLDLNSFGKVDSSLVQRLREISGVENVYTDEENLLKYGHDETEDLVFMPSVVVKPGNTSQVSRIMKLCSVHRIPVTPSGARTGLSGGALPVAGGIALSMERFNKIIEIDENNLQATVEPGVITQVFQEEVAKVGLFYPPDPSSRGSCFIGGNLAEGAGGPKAVKYGVTKDYVLNLEVVLPSGDIIMTGANVLKNSTGYNLTQLMVGSEGTLGIITKAVFRLIPKPEFDMLMVIPFKSAVKACEAVSAVFRAGITPSAMEFMERDAIDWVCKFEEITVPVGADDQAHLLVEVDGNDLNSLMQQCEIIAGVAERYDCGEILLAEDEAQKNILWKMRRKVAEAVKSNSVYKEEDTVVPRFKLPDLLVAVKEIGKKHGFRSVCYGHAGDGNLHINIIRGDLTDQQWQVSVKEGIREIFARVVEMGGTISGEHGIGWVQREFMPIAFPEIQLQLMKKIKNLFDPFGILNPGKIFP